MHRMVRVDEKTYRKLHEIAGGLQKQLGHRVSLSDSLDYLLSRQQKRLRGFWKAIREKNELGRAGRGPLRRARVRKTTQKQQLVHLHMNHRLEVS